MGGQNPNSSENFCSLSLHTFYLIRNSFVLGKKKGGGGGGGDS